MSWSFHLISIWKWKQTWFFILFNWWFGVIMQSHYNGLSLCLNNYVQILFFYTWVLFLVIIPKIFCLWLQSLFSISFNYPQNVHVLRLDKCSPLRWRQLICWLRAGKFIRWKLINLWWTSEKSLSDMTNQTTPAISVLGFLRYILQLSFWPFTVRQSTKGMGLVWFSDLV